MDKQTARIALLFATAISLPFARADDVHVLVKPEVSGTDMVYRYELINHGPNRMEEFGIGVKLIDPNDRYTPNTPLLGTLTRLPTNTLWGLGPEQSEEHPEFPNRRAGWLIPLPDPGSVTSPPGWRVQIGGALRVPGDTETPEDIARERYAITWFPPRPVDGGPLDVTGADAGQRLTGFSVRVPQDSVTGPGSLGALVDYTQGEFNTELWFGPEFYDHEKKVRRFNRITVSPSMEVSFITDPDVTYQTVSPSSLVTVTANIVPLVYGEPSPTIRLESIVCWGRCDRNEGVTGAAFGTDDRIFQLQAENYQYYDGRLRRYRFYDITYSVTDAASVRRTVMSTVTIVSRKSYY